MYSLHDAVVIEFSNVSTKDGPNMEPTVRASLTYTDKHRELLQITGGWDDHAAELVEFKIHQSHSLLVGFLRETQFVAVEYATAAEGGDQQTAQSSRVSGWNCLRQTDRRSDGTAAL